MFLKLDLVTLSINCSGLPQNQGNQGILLSIRQIREKFSEILKKVKEFLRFLLLHFRSVTFSTLNHTSS